MNDQLPSKGAKSAARLSSEKTCYVLTLIAGGMLAVTLLVVFGEVYLWASFDSGLFNAIVTIWAWVLYGVWLCLLLAILEAFLVSLNIWLFHRGRELPSRVGVWITEAVIAGLVAVGIGAMAWHGQHPYQNPLAALWALAPTYLLWGVVMVVRARTFGEWLLGWVFFVGLSRLIGGYIFDEEREKVLTWWARRGLTEQGIDRVLLAVTIGSAAILIYTGIRRLLAMRTPKD